MNTLKLKSIMISNDGGKTWVISRQYYLADMVTQGFLDTRLEGAVFERKNMMGDKNNGQISGSKTIS